MSKKKDWHSNWLFGKNPQFSLYICDIWSIHITSSWIGNFDGVKAWLDANWWFFLALAHFRASPISFYSSFICTYVISSFKSGIFSFFLCRLRSGNSLWSHRLLSQWWIWSAWLLPFRYAGQPWQHGCAWQHGRRYNGPSSCSLQP